MWTGVVMVNWGCHGGLGYTDKVCNKIHSKREFMLVGDREPIETVWPFIILSCPYLGRLGQTQCMLLGLNNRKLKC